MKIRIDKGIRYRGNSLYVTVCDHDPEVLAIINSYKCYKCKNVYELPNTAFNTLIDRLKFKDVVIKGKLSTEQKRYLKLLAIYDQEDKPYSSCTKPFNYQMDSYYYALDNNKFLLGDEQGLGKTKQALDIAVSRKHKMTHCLIICGVNGLKWNWLNEISIHTKEQGHILGLDKNKNTIGSVNERYEDLVQKHKEFFIITNIETLRDKRIQKQIKLMCETGVIGMTIIDEIHKAKNSTSIQGKAIHYCNSYYKLALTGTPLMNNPIDLYNILKWLDVEHHTLSYFKNRYCIMGGFGNYQIVGYQHLEELEQHLNAVMLRRTKDEVLELPDKIFISEYVEMSPQQRKKYYAVKELLRKEIDKILLSNNPLSQLIRLRQATGNPDILSSGSNQNCKYERMRELVEESVENNKKVIIFSNWTSIINPAVAKLKNYNPAVVTGEIKDKEQQLNKFKQDKSCKVILGTINCLGTGYNLTEANTIIFLDEPWTYALKSQAVDRAHRIGAVNSVNIYTLICKGTIDENIHEIIKNKQDLTNCIIDNKKQFIKNVLEG